MPRVPVGTGPARRGLRRRPRPLVHPSRARRHPVRRPALPPDGQAMLSKDEIAMLRNGRTSPILTADEAESVVWRMVSAGSSTRSTSAARLVEWIRARELAYISLREGVGRMLADAAERVGEAERAR